MRFRTQFYRFASWLTSGQSELVLYSLGLMQDAMADRFRLSMEARFPSFAPPDALALIGRDRGIVRGRGEPRDAYAARLLRYLQDLRVAGSPFALCEQLFHYLQTPNATIRTVDDRGNWFERAPNGELAAQIGGGWNWDGQTKFRFWVIIVNGPWEIRWDPSLGSWSGNTTATSEEVSDVMSIIRDWSPAGTQCEWVVVANGPAETTFAPGAPTTPHGTWGHWASGNPMRPTRSNLARYWRGPR